MRFQVLEEEWHDQTPTGPNKGDDEIGAPYMIKGTMKTDGLGICLWWDGE